MNRAENNRKQYFPILFFNFLFEYSKRGEREKSKVFLCMRSD